MEWKVEEIEEMYPGIEFSPPAQLTSDIGPEDTVIYVDDINCFPNESSYATIGSETGEQEIILYMQRGENSLSGCIRGRAGTAKKWYTGDQVACCFTNEQYKKLIDNIKKTDSNAKLAIQNCVTPYTHTKAGTVHQLKGADGASTIQFKATAAFTDNDTFTVNGTAMTAITLDGATLHTGDFATGSDVLAVVNSGKLTLQIRSYYSQMQNKANLAETQTKLWKYAVDTHIIDQNNIVSTDKNTLNTPYTDGKTDASVGTCYISYASQNNKTLLWLAAGRQSAFIQGYTGGKWGSWTELATATSPQVSDLPLTASFTASQTCSYFKTEDGIVTFFATVHKDTAISSGDWVFTLPVGFRSAKRIDFPASFANDKTDTIGGFGMLNTNGAFRAAVNASNGMTYAQFYGSFVATS